MALGMKCRCMLAACVCGGGAVSLPFVGWEGGPCLGFDDSVRVRGSMPLPQLIGQFSSCEFNHSCCSFGAPSGVCLRLRLYC